MAARSPGVLDGRPAGDAQRLLQLGGDDHRERRLAQPGRPAEQHVVGDPAAALRGVEHQPELLADPVLADELREGARPQRGLDLPLVVGVGDLEGGVDEPFGAARLAAHARLNVRRATLSRAATSGGSPAAEASSAYGAALATPSSASRADQPRPDQGAVQLVAPAPGCAGGPPGGRAAAVDRAEPVLELEDDPLGALATDAGHLHERGEVLGGDGAAQLVGAVDREHRLGEPRADPAGGLQQLEHDPLVVVGEPVERQRVLADDERGRQVGLLAEP